MNHKSRPHFRLRRHAGRHHAVALARLADRHAAPRPAFPRGPFLFASAACRRATFSKCWRGTRPFARPHLPSRTKRKRLYLQSLAADEPIHAVVEIARANTAKFRWPWRRAAREKIITHGAGSLRIRHLFNAIVTSEMVKNQKPAPDIFSKRRDALAWNRNSVAPTKTPIWACRPFVPPAWKRWTCANYAVSSKAKSLLL